MKRSAAFAAVLAVAAAVVATSAGAAAPSSLGVFAAESIASPLAIVTRVPAESAGGNLLSQSSVQLGKSQALAAGMTLGPLGDAFLITSAPGGLVTSIPAKVTAQDPPSDTSPREARFEQGQEAGPTKGAVLEARASDEPRAQGEASGSAIDATVVRTGASTSSSESAVLKDGTVTTTARTDVQDVEVGPAGVPPLTFASVSSLARVTIPPAGAPVTVLTVRVNGAQLAGVPVSIGPDGVVVAGNVAVPPSSIAAVNEALKAFAQRGVVLSAVPAVRESTAQGARTSGAALRIRYTVPEGGPPRPSDIGTDEEFLLGNVSASATARQRVPLGELPDLPSLEQPQGSVAAGTADIATSVGDPGVAVGSANAPGPGGDLEVPGPAAVPVPEPAVAAGFSLPARTSTAALDQLLASYRMFLLSAALGVGALLAFGRSRRTA